MLLRKEEGTFTIATSLADEGAINLLLSALLVRGDLIARGSFDSLPIPFRAVATDLHTGVRVTLDHGDLAQAIRASVAIPFVFEPITIDGRQLVDGGLSENVPVRLARELGATRVILSSLDESGTGDSTSRGASAGGTVDMLIDRIFLDAHPPLGPGDVEVTTNVADITNLDFSPAVVARLIERGTPPHAQFPRRRVCRGARESSISFLRCHPRSSRGTPCPARRNFFAALSGRANRVSRDFFVGLQ